MVKVTLKEYSQNDQWLFPPSIGSFVPPNSPARLVSDIVDQLDITEVMDTYCGGGTSSYHPRMMLKVIFFGYMNNIYSCRKIEKQMSENVLYMWLSGNQHPDFRTINDFRSKHLKTTINRLFVQVVVMLCEMGCLSLREAYIDGTKIESRANRYTFVWRKSVEKNRSKLESKIRSILSQIEEGIAQDNHTDDDPTTPINSEELKERIARINRENLSKADTKAMKELENKMLPKLEEYERKLSALGERNSYSKTDLDATFMRMKEDAMNNGQTKPGYNLQIATSRQFITWFSLFPNPTDTLTFIPFVSEFQSTYGSPLEETTADSGYGSEENYTYLENEGITPFVKYNYFHKEQHRPFKTNPFIVNNLHYNAEADYYVCPMGQHMEYMDTIRNVSDNGFVSYSSIYEARNCHGCPLRSQCHKSAGNRRVSVNHNLNRLKKIAFDLLISEEGLRRRSRRPIEPEAVFGQIKTDMGYKRFRHFGKDLVMMDFGILATAFNLKKLWKRVAKTAFFVRYCKIQPSKMAIQGFLSIPESVVHFSEQERLAA